MLGINFSKTNGSISRVLCLGAHCDDIEIGCGGTILRLVESLEDIIVYWIVFSSDELRSQEAVRSARDFLKYSKMNNIIIKSFKDGFLPFFGIDIKEYFDNIKKEFSPDIIFTHHRDDLHQDHRLISEMTWNTFRDNFILEYEVPKYEGDLGHPNFFVNLDDIVCKNKIQHIINNFKTQSEKYWFREETFMAMLTLRGVESKSPTKYAEAFHCRKIIF